MYEWLENNDADKILSLDTDEDKYGFNEKRGIYYDALADVISDMIIYEIPEHLLDEWLDFVSYEEIITDEWKEGARQSVRETFEEFNMEDYLRENAQTQVEHVTDHFRMLLAEHGQDEHQLPEWFSLLIDWSKLPITV